MTVTALRMRFPKLKVLHTDYTNFLNETFINFLKFKLGNQFISPEKNGFLNFHKICRETLNKYAPRERKTIRRSESLFINNEISNAIMKRTELRNKILRHKTVDSRQAFVKQRNYCVSLLKKSKRNYYRNLNVKDTTDNMRFWKTIKSIFSDKAKSAVSIILK